MIDFKQYVKEKLHDPAIKAEYDAMTVMLIINRLETNKFLFIPLSE